MPVEGSGRTRAGVNPQGFGDAVSPDLCLCEFN